MARSTYIYIVTNTDGSVTAFTVKHEMVRYVRNIGLDRVEAVVRTRDGVPKSGSDMGLEEYSDGVS